MNDWSLYEVISLSCHHLSYVIYLHQREIITFCIPILALYATFVHCWISLDIFSQMKQSLMQRVFLGVMNHKNVKFVCILTVVYKVKKELSLYHKKQFYLQKELVIHITEGRCSVELCRIITLSFRDCFITQHVCIDFCDCQSRKSVRYIVFNDCALIDL